MKGSSRSTALSELFQRNFGNVYRPRKYAPYQNLRFFDNVNLLSVSMISVAYHTARLNTPISKNRHISATNEATASNKRFLESSSRELLDSELYCRFQTAPIVEKSKIYFFSNEDIETMKFCSWQELCIVLALNRP